MIGGILIIRMSNPFRKELIDSEIELSVISIKKGSIPSFFRTVSLFFLVVDPFTL